MPPDAEDPRAADTRAWFAKAHLDLRCAETDLQAAPPRTMLHSPGRTTFAGSWTPVSQLTPAWSPLSPAPRR
jgi:hypothetical protein